MVILHLTTFLQGGAGLVIASLAAAQRAAGHEVLVVTSATGAPGYGNYPGHLSHLARTGVAHYAVDSLFSREPGAWEPVLDRLHADDVAVRADLCHAHAATPTRIARAFGDRVGAKPVVQTMHGWGMRKSEAQARADVEAMNLASAVVVPARTSASLLESLGVATSRLRLIEYGVGRLGERQLPPIAVETEMRHWQRAGGVVLCCPGTVGPRKNQRALLHALARLGPDLPSVYAVFVGEGETTMLSDEAARLGLAARVRVCGYQEDARHVTAAADFLVLPSLSEGQPLSVLEALADGVPALLSHIPELAEVAGDAGPRFLFDPHDPIDIARTITRAVTLSPEARRQLVLDGRARWAARFSLERMSAAYLRLYKEVLAA